MNIRELTTEEQERLLTQEDVNALPHGTLIWVKWSGGNGPHLYSVHVDKYGARYAAIPGEDHPIHSGGRLSFVGAELFHTRVYRPEDQK